MADPNAHRQDRRRTYRTSRDGTALPLLLIGLLALALSVWTLAGPTVWSTAGMIPVGWILIAGAIIVGLLLVVAPGKHR